MNEWQYKWIRPEELSPRIMDDLGSRGWEFAGPFRGDWVIFKRPFTEEGLECKCQPTWPPYAMVAYG